MTAPALLTETEAAEALRVCARTLRRLRKRGDIRYVAVTSRTVAYRLEDLQAFIEKRSLTCNDVNPTRRSAPRRQPGGGAVVGFTARRREQMG